MVKKASKKAAPDGDAFDDMVDGGGPNGVKQVSGMDTYIRSDLNNPIYSLGKTVNNVLLADGLEAQHHMYEAIARQTPSDAGLQAFVDARRAVGNEAAYGGADWPAELRRQRSRDLYMGGFRLGDLRRWARDGVGDFFPTGAHPNPDRPPAIYEEWTCHTLPLTCFEGNPCLEKPADPLTPPAGII